MSFVHRLALATAVLLGGASLALPADARPAGSDHHDLVLARESRPVTVAFTVGRPGEGLLDLVARAPGADWGVAGAEAAVVGVAVDGRDETDVVVPSARPIARQFQLGALGRGRHVLTLTFAADRSAPRVRTAVLDRLRVRTVTGRTSDAALAARFAPVLHGRDLAGYGGPLANATTDTPLVAWHAVTPATLPGHRIVETSYIWSNEDGGTDTPRLMARWGRTTDIEWIYRVEVDEFGDRVPGSDTFQAPAHTTTRFAGRYEGTHAVLQTCTENNNVCDRADDPMRFFLSTQQTLPAGQPREAVMDANPWTYQIMAAEMRREGKIEGVASPQTAAISDQRNYLFLALDKDTSAANSGASWVGLAVGVRLRGSATVYRSDHAGTGGGTDWSIQRDDPAATTVELPAGTGPGDIDEIVAYRVVNGAVDTGASIHATRLIRGFFLGADHLPQRSFVSGAVDTTLTPAEPSATIWRSASQLGA